MELNVQMALLHPGLFTSERSVEAFTIPLMRLTALRAILRQ